MKLSPKKARHLADYGYNREEIARLTGYTRGQVDYALDGDTRRRKRKQKTLTERVAEDMKYNQPEWFEGTKEQWRALVRANFCDILGE